MWIDELLSVIVGLGIVTEDVDIFTGARPVIPDGDGPFSTLRDTSSLPPVGTHNAGSVPAFQRPSAQITVRAEDPDVALAKAYEIYYAFYSVRNQFILDIWYLSIIPNQEPFELLPDNENRAVYTFNVVGDKLPSTAGGDLVGYYLIDDLGGDPNAFERPVSPDIYPTGITYDKLVPGSSIVIFSALPTGTIVFEASGKVESGGARLKLALFNLETDEPVTNGELVFDSGQTAGQRIRSSAIPIGINTHYGIKGTTDNVAIGGCGFAMRILHL